MHRYMGRGDRLRQRETERKREVEGGKKGGGDRRKEYLRLFGKHVPRPDKHSFYNLEENKINL